MQTTTTTTKDKQPVSASSPDERRDQVTKILSARKREFETKLRQQEAAAKEPIIPNLPEAEMKKNPLLDYTAFVLDWHGGRDAFRKEFGFVVLTQETAAALAKILTGLSCVEVAAGTGYLSHLLCEQGIDIKASDAHLPGANHYGFQKLWRNDHHGDSLELLPGDFDAVVLTWPGYEDNFGNNVLNAMKPGQMLVYEGESKGGCCGSDDFHEQLADEAKWTKLKKETRALNRHHLTFQGLHDHWVVYRKAA